MACLITTGNEKGMIIRKSKDFNYPVSRNLDKPIHF